MSEPRKKLFLLDALALIYRAHFAFSKNPRINSKGMNTGAALGFTNTLVEVLQKEQPTHIAVAFDSAAKTFRHDSFADYKANRQSQPEDISIAIPYCKKIVEAFNIPVLILDGYEADDIIGTMAQRAEKAGFDVYMMTPDKDYCQLVTEHVYLYKPAFMGNAIEVWDVQKILDKWEIERVEQVIDILGLQGDAVDNIPGIPGIGEKTAKTLIQRFGSVENLIANADQLKGKQKENVVNFADQGIMSKELATIHCDVPLEFNEEALLYNGPNEEQITELFAELEFRQLAQRVLGKSLSEAASAPAAARGTRKGKGNSNQGSLFDAPAAAVATADATATADAIPASMQSMGTTLHDYHLINTPELRQSLVQYLLKQDEISFDTETTSIDAITAKLVGMSFCYRPGEAYYVPVPPNDLEEAQRIVDEFRPVLENPNIAMIGQNIKYDILVMKNYKTEVKGPIFDTMIAHYLLEPEMRHNMDVLAETYLNYSPVPITDLIGPKGKNQKTMADLEPEEVKDYACEDADITLQLKLYFEPLLQEQGLMKLFRDIENPLVQVLADIEKEGISIDSDALADISMQLEAEIVSMEKRIFEIAGEQFNIGSPKQLGEILFDKLELNGKSKIKKTKTGQYATGEEILTKLAAENEIVRLILDHRQVSKLKSTYVDALPQLVCEQDNRVHTSFNQAVTATGRLSSTNPNLQNIPIRTERGREIRKAFVPRNSKHLIISADYSQIELRIMADFSGDPTMKEAFKNGIDVHASTASKVFHVPLEQVDAEMRRKAKMVNFGIIYGISAFGLAERLVIPRREAADIIEAYFQEFPAIKEYMDSTIDKARELEYAETILGRRRYLRDINSRNQTVRAFAERNAINAPIQGTAADIIKIAMINIQDYLKQEKLATRMILQVHDELLFDAPKEEVEIVTPKIVELMTNALPLSVPMEVGLGVGENWLEAH
ncbi:DNA polymerase I [Pontibacter akesuensis]|uniref:DNA polymerase I n=1 Tax=Pontibacter akesuensis TaxID=388950 RepID=A0A1I7I849_9BACT|nr:DNA polymerase I [Pontibacter akesuensis]GHA65751.1 DNA polymerase I [Pontibacter akesuensis]SFU69155.1 DNA polymerase I [Pontibacter akesuensis]